MPFNPERPNTAVEDQLLSEKVILCCGEDEQELLQAVRGIFPTSARDFHAYRCYRFWKFDEFTLLWTGIGTGCLEPLLVEILTGGMIRQIILIGTAGKLSASGAVQVGNVFCIDRAYLGGAAIRSNRRCYSPCFQVPHAIPTASLVSTDYYYGFSSGRIGRCLQAADPWLKQDYETWHRSVDMVDMETASFYHFCACLTAEFLQAYGLQYLSIKGPANLIDRFHEQTGHSQEILTQSLTQACRCMEIGAHSSRSNG